MRSSEVSSKGFTTRTMIGVSVAALVAVPFMYTPAHADSVSPYSVKRNAGSVSTVDVSWKPAAYASKYRVSVYSSGVEKVTILDSSASSFSFTTPDVCATYKVSVVAVFSDGSTKTLINSSYVPSLAPGGVKDVSLSRTDGGSVAHLSFASPTNPGVGTLSYRVKVKNLKTSSTVWESDPSSNDITVGGLDPDRMYAAKITAFNSYGSCSISTYLIGNATPHKPAKLQVSRTPEVPSDVRVSWAAPSWVGYGTIATIVLPTGPKTVAMLRLLRSLAIN